MSVQRVLLLSLFIACVIVTLSQAWVDADAVILYNTVPALLSSLFLCRSLTESLSSSHPGLFQQYGQAMFVSLLAHAVPSA